MGILKYIKERICEMIFKVQEVDETNIDIRERKLHVTVSELPNYLTHTAQDEDLIEVTSGINARNNQAKLALFPTDTQAENQTMPRTKQARRCSTTGNT